MNWFRRTSVLTKLLLSFVAVSVITCVVGWIGVSRMGTINFTVKDMYEDELMGVSSAQGMIFRIACIDRDIRESCLVTDPAEKQRLSKSIHGSYEEFLAVLKPADETTTGAAGRVLVDKVLVVHPKYWKLIEEADQLSLQNQNEAAFSKALEAFSFGTELRETVGAMVTRKLGLAKESYEDSERVYRSARSLMFVAIGGGVLLGISLGTMIALWFTRALLKVDEIASSVAAASDELAIASEQLSSGSQQSASSLEETAASLEQLTTVVRQNADNAVQAHELSSKSRETATEGGQVVTRAIEAMDEINRASRRIADITTTIDEIAFQTNLLALNAAVEAARAGEQGRGFAVVAGEVRNLAQRSATAAKEIKLLIDDSVAKVETGTTLVNHSGKTLSAIVASVEKVSDIVGEIASASREQSSGIDQINRAVAQMDSVTQANAAQVEEMSGTAVSLAEQADQLQALVHQFNLKKSELIEEVSPAPSHGKRTSIQAPGTSPRTVSAPARTTKSQPQREPQLVGSASGGYDGFEEF